MSLGSRIVRRGRAALSASGGLSSTPREHLLFLYPQWVRTAATAAQGLTVGGSQQPPSTVSDHLSHNETICKYGVAHESAASEPSGYTEVAEEKYGAASEIQRLPSRVVHPTQDGTEHTEDQAQQSIGKYGKAAINSDCKDTVTLVGKAVPVRHILSKYEKGNALSRPILSTYEKRNALIRRICASHMRRTGQRNHGREVREDHEELKARERRAPLPDWSVILADLAHHTPNGSATWHDNALRIRVPFEAVGKLIFEEDYTIWAIKTRCGCQIEVSNANEASQAHRILLISGSSRNIAKAAAEILRIAPEAISEQDIWSLQVPGFSTRARGQRSGSSGDGSPPNVTRSVRSDKRQHMARPVRADEIKRPACWTTASFGMYVQSLTSIKMSNHMHRLLYKHGEYHNSVVMDILQALFLDPKCKTAISVAALNDALAFLVKHNNIGAVHDLYVHMCTQNLRMTTETFNIMLRGTAKSKSLLNFKTVLSRMLLHGYTPNPDTWVAFMGAMEDFKPKLYVLEGMKRKGLLYDPRIQKSVCEHLVEKEIQTSLDKKITQEQFFQHMANHYGQDWLTTSSANRILDTLGSRGLISSCWDFFKFMHNRDVKPDDVSILAVLYHCERQGNVEGAIEIIRRVSSLIGLVPNQDIYHTLFNIAWDARLHCVARLVWRYACLHAATTFRMRKRVYESAQIAFSVESLSSKTSIRREWNATACPFILGLSYSNLHQRYLSDIPLLPLSRSEDQAPRKKDNTIKLIRAAIRKQMRVFQDWVPQKHFADMLTEAYATDKKLTSSGVVHMEERMEWLNQRAPAVPLLRKAPPRRRTPSLMMLPLNGCENSVLWK